MGTRVALSIMKIVLASALLTWLMMAPLAWILRDGLGPRAVHSVGVHAVMKFCEQWGVLALAIAVPLVGVVWIERRVVR